MIATLVPEPGRTPIREVYRAFAGTPHTPLDHGAFDRASYDPASVAEARARWKKRMVDEYTSTTVFSALVAQVVEANASIDASAVALKMAADELRHAEICGQVVVALGGSSRARRETTVRPIAVHPSCGPEERALRNVLTTCLSEMYSIAFFVASLDRMEDPYLRAVTRELLTDEVLHGRFGFYYLEGCGDWLASRPDVRASVSRYLRYVFAVCEREFVREPRARAGADDDALGLVPSDLARDVFLDTMESAVAPGLERFGLDATRAWRDRALA
ncbi:MAG: ferritin-like domain-containing protein [Sandaracinaceae bacterium]|nr:ferritin-like domain-containing protein [Sandaracinaceae bacterium]